MARGLMTEDEWAVIGPFVTETARRRGRPPRDHRRTLDAVLRIARTGVPWRDLPAELGNWNPVHRQFRRWMCGRIATAKSMLSARLGEAPAMIVVVQDHWMARLWPDELRSVADHGRMVARLRAAMGPRVVELLRSGLSVVLDWPANTVTSRRRLRKGSTS